MSAALTVPLCATCGQASTAGCPGCELRQAAGGPPYPVVRETPTRLEGRAIDGALMLAPAVELTPLPSVEMKLLLTEQEAREASKPLGLYLFEKRPRHLSTPAICVYTRRPQPPLVDQS